MLGRLTDGGSGQRLLAGCLPELNGVGVLTGVRQVMSNEVGSRGGPVGEVRTKDRGDPAVILLAYRAE
jgi:hypothetical protein